MLLGILWGVIAIGIITMKKIEPHNRWYLPYAVLIGALTTAVTSLS